MSQWLRGGFTFFGDGDSPVAAVATAPQTRHLCGEGHGKVVALGTVESDLMPWGEVGVAVVLVARGSEPSTA
jgi:hypothetical protein